VCSDEYLASIMVAWGGHRGTREWSRSGADLEVDSQRAKLERPLLSTELFSDAVISQPTLNPASAWTVEAWVYLDGLAQIFVRVSTRNAVRVSAVSVG
jgi:hypothetical protein